jgi:GR25 family glycosyltransferase involved in LPS biosynthesis
MNPQGLEFYFINLDSRKDRLQTFISQFKYSNLPLKRVQAISYEDINLNEPFATPEVVATWKSHQKAYRLLIESNNSYAVIFEDDANISRKALRWLENCNSNSFRGIDLLQIGYLQSNKCLTNIQFDPSPWKLLRLNRYIGRRLSSIDLIYRFWIRQSRFYAYALLSLMIKIQKILFQSDNPRLVKSHNYFLSERKVREQLGLNTPVVYHSFEPGTHAYVISREFAAVMVNVNSPVFLPADLLFMGVARSQNFRIIRLSRSMSKQYKSPSSINKRTIG